MNRKICWSGRSLIWSTIPAFFMGNWEEPRKISVMISVLQAETGSGTSWRSWIQSICTNHSILVFNLQHYAFVRKFIFMEPSSQKVIHHCQFLWFLHDVIQNSESIVTRLHPGRPGSRESIPGRCIDFIFSQRLDRPWGLSSLLSSGYRQFFPGGKTAGVWRWPFTCT
jgi:hypothetical protein